MSRDRDRTLEQALTHELRSAGTPDRDACVDAETLGAWADGGLDGAQMAAVELHVSTCARCMAIVGATARSAPATGTEAAGTFFSWRWWLAPIAATAAAVTLWMVVPEQRRLVVAPPPAAAPAQETFARSQPADQAIPDRPGAGEACRSARPRSATALSAPTLLKRRATIAASGRSPRAKKSLAAKKDKNAPKLSQEVNVPPGPLLRRGPDAAPRRRRGPERARGGRTRKSARFAVASVVIVSPDPSRRWRIANGAIERSEDGGATWISDSTPGW